MIGITVIFLTGVKNYIVGVALKLKRYRLTGIYGIRSLYFYAKINTLSFITVA